MCINSNNLIENQDYRLGNVAQPVPQGGFSNKKEYILTPYALKLCLIRAKNSKIYANYYLLLEKVFKNYNDYQFGYQKYILSMKDDKLLIFKKKNQFFI